MSKSINLQKIYDRGSQDWRDAVDQALVESKDDEKWSTKKVLERATEIYKEKKEKTCQKLS